MKRIIFLIILLTAITIKVRSQTWQWSSHCGGLNSDYATSICADSSGNIYMTGKMSIIPQGGGYQVYFGNDTITYFTNDLADIFITKLDNSGNFTWVKKAGGYNMTNAIDHGYVIYESTSNSLIVCGSMDNGGTPSISNCQFNGDWFLSRLDLDGNCIYAVNIGFGYGGVYSIDSDNDNHIYVLGILEFGGLLGGNMLSAGVVLGKFRTTDGSCVWAKHLTDYNPYGGKIKYYNGNLYLSGVSVNDTLVIDGVTAYCHEEDVYISKFDTTGNLQWVKTMGGPYSDIGGTIGLDGNGNIYTSGIFTDTTYFENDTLVNTGKDFYFAKYDNNGNLKWVKQASTTALYAGNVSTTADGNTYVTGTYTGSATFGNYTINAATSSDMFVARFDSTGNALGATNAENIFLARDILTTSSGSFIIAGTTNSGTSNFGNTSVTSYGTFDAFIAKHDVITRVEELRSVSNQLYIYANPNKGTCTITVPDEFYNEKNLLLQIYDNAGRLLQQSKIEIQQDKIKVNIEAEASGVYPVILTNGKKSYSGKIVFE